MGGHRPFGARVWGQISKLSCHGQRVSGMSGNVIYACQLARPPPQKKAFLGHPTVYPYSLYTLNRHRRPADLPLSPPPVPRPARTGSRGRPAEKMAGESDRAAEAWRAGLYRCPTPAPPRSLGRRACSSSTHRWRRRRHGICPLAGSSSCCGERQASLDPNVSR